MSRLPTLALAVAMGASAALILYLTRGFTFYYDEWNFVINRQAFTADTLLRPHNEHNVFVPALLFKGLWELVGLDDYWAFRLLVVVLHLLCAGLLYVIARRRVGDQLALASSVILLFLGTAWEVTLWPFEIQFLIPVAAGMGMLLALERRDLRGDIAADGLLLLAFGSGSLGVPLAVGATVEILFGRERLSRLLRVVAVPCVLYAAWVYHYRPPRNQYADFASVPGLVVDQLASVLAAIAGFSYDSVRPVALALALVFAVLVAERLIRQPDRARLTALAVMALAYWGALALYRPEVSDQPPSRYLYAGAVFVLLIAIELARGRTTGRRGLVVVGLLVVVAVASNVGDLRKGARELRSYSEFVAPGLGALELARGTVEPGFKPEPTRAPDVVAAKYFAATDSLGSPADTPTEMLSRPEESRQAADIVLLQALRLRLAAAHSAPAAGAAPGVTRAEGGAARVERGCARFTPVARRGSLEVRVPAGGVTIEAAAGPPVQVYLRRFASEYVPAGVAPAESLFFERQGLSRGLLRATVMELRGGTAAVLRIPADRASRPWRARLVADQPVTVC